MKRKGFTIVEILAAVVIIAILSVVVIPNISSYIAISKDEYNKDVKKQMILAGKNYYSENQERLPRDTSEKTMDYISVQELSTLKYVDNEFVDADDNSCMEKSYVVAANKGLGINYYACMICGDNSYIEEDEEFYCDAVNYIDNNGNSDEDGSGDEGDSEDGESSDGSLTCVVDKETTGYTDDGLYVTLTATSNKEDGYITSVYVINKDTKSDEEQLSDADKNKKSVTTTVYFPEYGENDVYAMDNSYNKVKCTTVNYKEPTNTKFNVKQYYVTEEEYESHKNTGFTNQELEELPEYDGTWKNGYIYVKLDYYNFQYDSIEIDGEDIAIGKKYFFIEDEGETTTKIVATRSDEGSSDIVRNITAKLDRTAPTVTLSNSSSGKWTNKDVTVTVNAKDTGGSGIASKKYGTSSSSMSSNVPTNSKVVWSKTNRNVVMYVQVTDNAGNKSSVASTNVRQDITPPTVTLSNSSSGSWTNKAVTVTVSAKDTGGSGIASKKYGTSSSSMSSNVPTNSKVVWSKTNRNVVMYVQVTDKAGNKSSVASTNVRQDITPPTVYSHCFYQKASGRWKFRYYMRDTGGSGLSQYRWNYCYSICPGCHSSYMCSSKSAYNRMIATGWRTASPAYKQTGYNIKPTSGARTIQATARMQVKDKAGNIYTSPNYTDRWTYSGGYSPGKC